MRGFFNIEKPVAKRGQRKKKHYDCTTCGLEKTGCITPRMPPTGNGDIPILFVAEAPGKSEDSRGIQLIGQAGQYLRDALHDIDRNFDLDDCRKTNAVICRPPKNATPKSPQIASCRRFLHEEIESFQPKVIVTLGSPAIESCFGDRYSEKKGFGVMKWRGFQVPDQKFGAWVCPTMHPSYVMRMEGEKNFEAIYKIWLNDLERAIGLLDAPFPKYGDEASCVEVITDPKQAALLLRDIYRKKPELMAFDFETSGLKPHRAGHFIKSASICTEHGKAYSFLWHDSLVPIWNMIMTCEAIGKMAHNMAYEDTWNTVINGVRPVNWVWCSLQAAHVLDNRQGISGLKFQATVNFGLFDYEDTVKPYLEATEEETDKHGANAFNRINEAPLADLLLYGGIDSLVQYRLAIKQMEAIYADPGLTAGYNLIHNGILAYTQASRCGFHVNTKHVEAQYAHMGRRIDRMKAALEDFPEVVAWKEREGKDYNPDSNPQLAKTLFVDMGIECPKTTAKGGYSTDEETLSSIEHPLVRRILDIRKLSKARGTYFGGLLRETVDGVLHPSYKTNTVRTYRSSCSDPNIQNFPIRDPLMGKIIRKAIIAPYGYLLGEVDYSGIEVRVAASYHRDPTMIAYLEDPTKDMHRDMAMECYMLSIDEVCKPCRQAAKTYFVFAQFYGDYYKSCAEKLWHEIEKQDLKTKQGVPLYEHLRKKGIRDVEDFIEHVKKVEKAFWEERFPVFNEWRIKQFRDYLRDTDFRMHTGLICSGIMARNDVINYGTQGVASHCLMKSFTELQKEMEDRAMRSYLAGQIHDSLLPMMHPEEFSTVLNMAESIMCAKLKKDWDFLDDIPIDIEADVVPIGKTWYDKKPVVRHKCSCGEDWAWETKGDGFKVYECPICDTRITEGVV